MKVLHQKIVILNFFVFPRGLCKNWLVLVFRQKLEWPHIPIFFPYCCSRSHKRPQPLHPDIKLDGLTNKKFTNPKICFCQFIATYIRISLLSPYNHNAAEGNYLSPIKNLETHVTTKLLPSMQSVSKSCEKTQTDILNQF